MGTTPLTYQETFALVRELNNFADNMDKKIGALQSSYSTGKAAMLKKHSQSISTFDSNSASAIGSIKAKSKALLADAEKMQRDILALDEQLSAVDKYYVKTKKKKEEELAQTKSDKFGDNGDYFQTLSAIRDSYIAISDKYSKDILPGLINGLNFLFSSKRKQDYEELIILKNTLAAFVAEMKSVIPELMGDAVSEMEDDHANTRLELCQRNQIELTTFEENYTANLMAMADEIGEGLDRILPDELVDYIADLMALYNGSYSKINAGKYVTNDMYYLGVVDYPIGAFIQSKTLASFINEKCKKLIKNGSIKFPVIYSTMSPLPFLLKKDATASATDFVNGVIYSFLSSISVSHLKLSFIDCENHGNSAEAFFDSKKKMPELFDDKIYTEQETASEKIRQLNDRVENITQNILGSEYESIFDYAEKNPNYAYSVELLTIYDFPGSLDARAMSNLRNILANGSKCGIHVILCDSNNAADTSSREYADNYEKVVKMCLPVHQQGNFYTFFGLEFSGSKMPPKAEYDSFFSSYMLRNEAIKNHGIGFSSILKDLVDSEDDDSVDKNISIIRDILVSYHDRYGRAPKATTLFPRYMVSGTVHYPMEIFEDCHGFEKIKGCFDDKNGRVELPLIWDLAQSSNVFMSYSEDRYSDAVAFTHQVIWSALSSIPATKANVCVIDNDKKGGSITPFLEFRKKCPDVFDDALYTDADAIYDRLLKLNRHIDSLIQDKLGSKYPTVVDYNQSVASMSEPVTVLSIYDFPSGFDSRSIDLLLNILKNGGKCGVYTLLCYNRDVNYSSYDNIAERIVAIKKFCSVVDCKSKSYELQPFNLPITIKPALNPSDVDRFVAEYEKTISEIKRKGLSFNDILDHELFSRSSEKTLDIPVGVGDGESIVPISFGVGSSHHALVAGATGSGKSTLLHTLIMSSMLHYSPDELNLYLMDFKSGTEFKIYDSLSMPHIKLIALDAMQEFGESILENLVAEMTLRSEKFKTAQVSKLSEYVKATGQPMPRILVVMDEFQILFNDASNRKVANNCAELTKRIVTEGRSYGIHLVMATQSTKIITDLTLSSGTIEQMRIRIGLKCGEYDAHYLFTDRNDTKALEMMKGPIGTAVMNPEYTEGDNIKFRAAYCDDDTQNSMLKLISEKFTDYPDDTQTFEGSKTTQLLDVLNNIDAIRNSKPLSVQVGTLIKVAPPLNITFDRRRKHNTLICGASERMADNLMNLYCLDILLNKYSNVYYIDGETLLGEDDENGYLAQFARFGNKFNWAKNRADIIRFINKIYDFYVEQRKGNSDEQVYVFIKNLQFVDLIKTMFKGESIDESEYLEPDEISSDDEFDFGASSSLSVSEKLLKLVDDGSAYGIHFIVSSLEYQTVKESMYYGENVLTKFPERYVFSLSDSDSDSLVDGVAVSSLRDNTVYYSDSVKNTFQLKPYIFPKVEGLKAFLDKQISKEGEGDEC